MFIKLKRIYFPFAVNLIKTEFAYRFSIFFFFLGRVLTVITMMLLWNAIYQNSPNPELNGFTVNGMIHYLFLTSVIGWIAGSSSSHIIAREVKSGSIAMNLLKPISFQLYLLFMDIGRLLLNLVLIIIPSIFCFYVFAYFNLDLESISITNVLLGVISLTLGYFTMYFFEMCFGFLSFYTQYMWGLFQIKNAILIFLSGALIPFTFFPDVVEKVLTFSPFATVGYVPALMIMGKFDSGLIGVMFTSQVIWLSIFGVVSYLVWKHAVKRMVILGG